MERTIVMSGSVKLLKMHLLMPDALSGWTEESRTALRSTCPSEGKLTLYEAIHGPVPHYFRALIHYSIVRQTTATIAQSHFEIRLRMCLPAILWPGPC